MNTKLVLKCFKEHQRLHAQANFEGLMERLPGWVGCRHKRLPLICRIGREAGLTDEEICTAVLNNCGEPRLGINEVRQALNLAPLEAQEEHRPEYDATPEERAFVQQTIEKGRGTTVRSLQEKALLAPTSVAPRAAMSLHIRAMCKGACKEEKLWLGKTKYEGVLYTVAEAERGIPREPQNFATCNTLSGEYAPKKNGLGMTNRGDACVINPSRLLVEFDEMSKEDQLAFIGGLIETGELKPISVVYSGSKSFHTLLEVEGDYKAFVAKVRRLCCSAADPRYRADTAVLHPSALTRLAGAVRQNDDGSVNLQELVWYRV